VLFVLAVLLVLLDVVEGTWAATLVIVAGLVEIGETAFWFWLSKRRRVQVGAGTLIGAEGELASDGLVRVDGELWQARGTDGLSPGAGVRVVARDGLVLSVEPVRGRP